MRGPFLILIYATSELAVVLTNKSQGCRARLEWGRGGHQFNVRSSSQVVRRPRPCGTLPLLYEDWRAAGSQGIARNDPCVCGMHGQWGDPESVSCLAFPSMFFVPSIYIVVHPLVIIAQSMIYMARAWDLILPDQGRSYHWGADWAFHNDLQYVNTCIVQRVPFFFWFIDQVERGESLGKTIDLLQ